MNRFLVTTALEETWPKETGQQVLFLGEWCRIYTRKDRWSKMNTEVLPYHWDDREKLHLDYLYLQGYYERLLPLVSKKLNDIHKVDHSMRYWRILIGPWLGYFLQVLYDRWTAIYQAVNQYEINGTTILDYPEESMIPQGMRDFVNIFVSDEWNHYIYSKIIYHTTKIRINNKRVKRAFNFQNPDLFKIKKRKKSKKETVYNIMGSIFCLDVDKNALMIATSMPLSMQQRLEIKLKQAPKHRDLIPISKSEIDLKRRSWSLEQESRTDFERFINEFLAYQIPAVYLEGYNTLIEQVDNNDWPKMPKLIWTSNAEISNDHFKAYAAANVEHGAPLVIGQHGGHYGIGKWSFVEEHECALADRYFSWGWTEDQRPEIRPIGQLKHKKTLGINHFKQENILLVTCTVPRYSYHLSSSMIAGQWIDYLEDQFIFCQTLPSELRNVLTVRLYKEDYGWNQSKRWKDRWPSVKLDDGKRDINKLIKNCRIFVSTYNATTFLESLSMNIPTVIFWNPNHWELRDSAKPYFESLKNIGVFHETSESAAQHIAKVWDNVEEWWKSETTSNTIRDFCNNYSKIPKDLVHDIFYEFKDLIEKNRGHI